MSKAIPHLILALAVAFMPHVIHVPAWVLLFCFTIWSVVYFMRDRPFPILNRPLRLMLTFAAASGVLITFGRTIGRDAGVVLLSLMLSIKLLEMKSHRDRMLMVFLIYFLIITNLLFFESLAMTLYMFISVLVATATLIRLNHPLATVTSSYKTAGAIIGQAIPAMLILFFLFPRLEFGLWGKPGLGGSGVSGFSEHLTLGGVARVALSTDVAFRASFSGQRPPSDRLYWRGLVLWRYENNRWDQGEDIPFGLPASIYQPLYSYTVDLEPHGHIWLFSLDYPSEIPIWINGRQDGVLSRRFPVKKKLRYALSATPSLAPVQSPILESMALSLPSDSNPKTRDLAKQWTQETSDPLKLSQRMLDMFAREGFFYTLNPPALGRNEVDDFLFTSKNGFCEHFAASYAFMMRACGVPCRIVVGYLGGEINPYTGQVIVRQSDAHAWAEIFVPNRGWIRVDPTTAATPRRLEEGLDGALTAEDLPWLLRIQRYGALSRFINTIRFGWDILSIQWSQWILDYSAELQRGILSGLGLVITTLREMTLVFILSLIGIVFLGLIFRSRAFFAKRPNFDPVQRIYLIFCARLAAINLARSEFEGPMDYAERVTHSRPDLAGPVMDITKAYIDLRYAGVSSSESMAAFGQAVRSFKPKKT